MGLSSSVSSWLVGIPSVPAAAPAWPLVALDAFHPVADNTPCVTAGVLPPTAADLPPDAHVLKDTLSGVAPVLDDTPHPAVGVLLGVASVLDDTPHPAAGVFLGVASVLDDTPHPAVGIAPVLDDTPRPAAGVLPGVASVLDDLFPGIEQSVS